MYPTQQTNLFHLLNYGNFCPPEETERECSRRIDKRFLRICIFDNRIRGYVQPLTFDPEKAVRWLTRPFQRRGRARSGLVFKVSARFNLRELRPGSLLPGCSALKRPVILYHAMPEEENRWIVGVSTIRRRGTVWGKARRSKVQVLPKIRRRCVHFYRGKDYLLSLSPFLHFFLHFSSLASCALKLELLARDRTTGVSLAVCALLPCSFFAVTIASRCSKRAVSQLHATRSLHFFDSAF